MKISVIFFSFSIAAVLAGCERDPSSGLTKTKEQTFSGNRTNEIEANKARLKLGLRQIKLDWFLYRSSPSQDDWKIQRDGFLAKAVFKDSTGTILSEEDYYYSGSQFTDLEGRGWERVTVRYDYNSKEISAFYIGTNAMAETALAKFQMPQHRPSTNVAEVINAVKTVIADWPDNPK